MTTRLLSPPSLAPPYNAWVNGTQYSGPVLDVISGTDAMALEALGWVPMVNVQAAQSGPSNARSAGPAGTCFVDTTTNLVIVWDGAQWRNPIGGSRV